MRWALVSITSSPIRVQEAAAAVMPGSRNMNEWPRLP